MRSKFDDIRISAREEQKKRPLYGGKALQRMLAYLGQRDPALSAAVMATLGVPKSAQSIFGIADESRQTGPAGITKSAKTKHTRRATAKRSATATIKASTSSKSNRTADTVRSNTIAAAAPAPVWQALGPSLIPNGQTYGDNLVEVSGRVSSIVVDPSDPKHLLLGAGGGGIWESKDTGATWMPRTDDLPSLAIGAIAFDPKDPSIVYAGSGEGNGYANLGAGIYLSTDGGKKWDPLPSTISDRSTTFNKMGFFDLVVDPQDSNILYAAVINPYGLDSGFYKSVNRGNLWSLIRGGICWDISVHPGGGSVELLAAFEDGLFVLTNAGDSFDPVTLLSAPETRWTRLAVDRVRTSPDVAYAFGAIWTGYYQEPHLWRREAGTWTKITSLPPVSYDYPWTNQANYDWFVAATPDNESEVYLGAIDLYRGTLNGPTWTFSSISTQGLNSIHPDQHCLAFSPDDSKIIYVGNDGGIFRSANSGANWEALNKGLEITEIEYLTADPNTSQWIMAGTQDNGTIRFMGSPVWDQIAQGDGGDCGVNPLNPNEVYHSYNWDSRSRSLPFDISLDKGDTWISCKLPMDAQFYPPVEACGSTVAIGGTELIVSRDRGLWWAPVPLGLDPLDGSTAMHLSDADTVFIGTNNGRVIRVDWKGANWSASPLTSPTHRYISSIVGGTGDPRRLWATISQPQDNSAMLYRSDDGGGSWTPCEAGLPPIPMNSITVDPGDPDRAWVATDVGVYETRDAGKSWARFGVGLPNAMAADILFHAKDRKLICGTRSRGAWAVQVPT